MDSFIFKLGYRDSRSLVYLVLLWTRLGPPYVSFIVESKLVFKFFRIRQIVSTVGSLLLPKCSCQAPGLDKRSIVSFRHKRISAHFYENLSLSLIKFLISVKTIQVRPLTRFMINQIVQFAFYITKE